MSCTRLKASCLASKPAIVLLAMIALAMVSSTVLAEQRTQMAAITPAQPLAQAMANDPATDPGATASPQHDWYFPPPPEDQTLSWQVVPDGLMYNSYLAGVREPRFASVWNYEEDWGWMWDIALGGRVSVLRHGTSRALLPDGWELQLEGAAFPRLDMEHQDDVIAADYRFGIPLAFGFGRYRMKFAFYHLSSHLGDEFMLRFPEVERINFSRNAFVWGHSYYLTDELRLYGEMGWAFDKDGGNEPWEFQFGLDYVSLDAMRNCTGTPFFAINSHLRQELNFGGNLVVQTGWAWPSRSGNLFRVGMQYYAGKSEQYEFFRKYEEKIGLGVWYDF